MEEESGKNKDRAEGRRGATKHAIKVGWKKKREFSRGKFVTATNTGGGRTRKCARKLPDSPRWRRWLPDQGRSSTRGRTMGRNRAWMPDRNEGQRRSGFVAPLPSDAGPHCRNSSERTHSLPSEERAQITFTRGPPVPPGGREGERPVARAPAL